MSLAAAALLLGVLSLHLAQPGGGGSAWADGAGLASRSPALSLRFASFPTSGQSTRDMQREAERRQFRRQRRRFRRNGGASLLVPGATPVRPTTQVVSGSSSPVPILLALCALLALPVIASRLWSSAS